MGGKVQLLLFALVTFVACGRSTISERDVRRDQIRNSAENKRKELQPIVGNYSGTLTQTTGTTQAVVLKLEIKDIPTPVEGQVDPIMVPVLTGFLKFNLGGGADPSEYVGFGVTKAEFDPKRKTLDLVVANEKYKDVILALQLENEKLTGSWTAPAIAASGSAELVKNGASQPSADELRGEYAGVLIRDAQSAYQYSHLTISTSFVPPDGLKVTAVWRVIFGEWKSPEYLTYTFESVSFNPLSGQIVLKADGNDASFVGTVSQGKLQGEWFSNYTGKLGAASFEKSLAAPAPGPGERFEALRGTYQGKLTNTHPQSNLPERVMVSFVTSQDLTQPSGIKITGSLRFYLGGFESTEYIEVPFESVQYNFFTRQLVAKATNEQKLTLKGEVSIKEIEGNLSSDGLGEVARVEVKKI